MLHQKMSPIHGLYNMDIFNSIEDDGFFAFHSMERYFY